MVIITTVVDIGTYDYAYDAHGAHTDLLRSMKVIELYTKYRWWKWPSMIATFIDRSKITDARTIIKWPVWHLTRCSQRPNHVSPKTDKFVRSFIMINMLHSHQDDRCSNNWSLYFYSWNTPCVLITNEVKFDTKVKVVSIIVDTCHMSMYVLI